jgi:hypothetical protein
VPLGGNEGIVSGKKIVARMIYSHLGLRDWPFRIVPEPEFCDFLAARSVLRNDVKSLLVSMENRPTSDIQLIWSWYGAGKTHTLYYLANQCSQEHRRLLPIYTELPREAKGFFDLYRVTISQFPLERLIDAHLENITRPISKMGFSRAFNPDLNSALTQAALGERPTTVLLNQWLLGNPLPTAALRELGVGGRVNTTERCAEVLADVISLLAPRHSDAEARVQRVIWIIDEVQRVEEPSPMIRRSILSGLVGVFNRCPTGLTLLLSYTGTPQEKSLPDWIPRDLADRIGLERPMLLPPLRSDEARLFVQELLEHFRLPEARHLGTYYPFETEAIEDLLKALGRDGDLKPRSIMEALDASLRHLEPLIRAGEIKSIGAKALRDSLARLSIKWTESSPKKKG